MKYAVEKDFAIYHIHLAFERFAKNARKEVQQKSEFDLVTNVDTAIEQYLTREILQVFPGDHIHAEEFSNNQPIVGRTWVFDPIDGTVNMARDIPLYGIQLALFDGGEVVMSVIYLPFWEQTLWAIAGEGCYCNDQQVFADRSISLNNALLNFGDYTHKSDALAARMHRAVGYVYPKVAKLRMVGAACVDFALIALGKTHGVVFTTTNLWDLAPGILLCQEAGAQLSNLDGEPYRFGDSGVLVGSNEQVLQLFQQGFAQ